jgi:hypothetical protein
MLMFMLQWLGSRVWVSEVQLTSSSSSARGRLGDGGTVRKLVVATTAGADDAMPARREKAIFGYVCMYVCIYYARAMRDFYSQKYEI